MKNTLFIIFTIFLIASCDPPNDELFNDQSVKLNATLNNTNEVINLGDTLKFTLTIPDIVVSNTQSVSVSTLQEGFYYLRALKIDTVTKLVNLVQQTDIFMSAGEKNGPSVYCSKAAKPFESLLNFKPSSKGIYYFEIVTQPGRLKVNNSYSANLIVNFAVADKHHVMLDSYFGNGFLAAATQIDQQGFGIYGFKVQ